MVSKVSLISNIEENLLKNLGINNNDFNDFINIKNLNHDVLINNVKEYIEDNNTFYNNYSHNNYGNFSTSIMSNILGFNIPLSFQKNFLSYYKALLCVISKKDKIYNENSLFNYFKTKKFFLFIDSILSLLYFIVEGIVVIFSNIYYPDILKEIGIIDSLYNESFDNMYNFLKITKEKNKNDDDKNKYNDDKINKIKELWDRFYIKKSFYNLNSQTLFKFTDYSSIYLNFEYFKDFDYIYSRNLSKKDCYVFGYIVDNLINAKQIEFPLGFPKNDIVNNTFKRI